MGGVASVTAVMECEPIARVLVAKVVVPAAFNVPVPRAVAPSLNVTVPVGVPDVELTVAVKVLVVPGDAGFNEEDKLVVVLGDAGKRPKTVTTLVAPMKTWPFAIVGVVNLFPEPQWSRPPAA